MTAKHNGGPAFPTEPRGPAYGDAYNGMTLRDWFAGQVLANIAETHHGKAFDPVGSARSAYEIADAMLEARK